MPSLSHTPNSGRSGDPEAAPFAETFARRPTVPRRGLLPGTRVWATTAAAAALTGAGVMTLPLLASIDLTSDPAEPSSAVAVASPDGRANTAVSPAPSGKPDGPAAPGRERDSAPAPWAGGPFVPVAPGGRAPAPGSGAVAGQSPDTAPASGATDQGQKQTLSPGSTAAGGTAGSGKPARDAPVDQTRDQSLNVSAPGVPLVGAASGRCIDVTDSQNGVGRSGTRLQIWTCSPQDNQKWSFRSDGTVRSLGMCMNVAGGSTQSGAAIQLATCNGGPGQQFYLAAAGDLVNRAADKCVDVLDKGTASGTALQLWTCKGSSNQKWRKG
ncbi:ricin-type beta-trefoil lectin domain protein [Streptomyces sp. AK02-01A]|uniref:ricin-type beta-trefoil lectin domain protein n=1 Tax=Streptomyces sp. AK02-01A TaxID=3028648 RepID=UPI0029A0EEF3|nr:ricin-type beta-trefoil lectin domain protein [Streptomyces sp. AK02-01A]MDX3850177.1 ricin-type beta-trefoil lectin domain protein [Streptomyces sp. AK02-01A]